MPARHVCWPDGSSNDNNLLDIGFFRVNEMLRLAAKHAGNSSRRPQVLPGTSANAATGKNRLYTHLHFPDFPCSPEYTLQIAKIISCYVFRKWAKWAHSFFVVSTVVLWFCGNCPLHHPRSLSCTRRANLSCKGSRAGFGRWPRRSGGKSAPCTVNSWSCQVPWTWCQQHPVASGRLASLLLLQVRLACGWSMPANDPQRSGIFTASFLVRGGFWSLNL